jgi:RNA polymerase sigma-70 factor (ECF subfamily)
MLTTTDVNAPRERPAMKRNPRDETEFLALIECHRGIVRKVAMSYSRNAADRHDVEQEIIAQLWKSWPAFDGQRPFATWMYRVALNVAISIARTQRWQEPEPALLDEAAADLPGHDEVSPEQRQNVHELMAFIGGLDELNRALILLYLEDLSYREIADIVGISETNVATKIHRAKQSLRARMNPERT